jgi:ABC-type transport system substrate-binding protein
LVVGARNRQAETYRIRLKKWRLRAGDAGIPYANFPDTENFYNFPLRRDSTQNQYHFRNEQMDFLLETAGIEPDWNKRIAYYRIAGQMLYTDVPVIILSNSGPECILRKPSIMVFPPTFTRVLRTIFMDQSISWLDASFNTMCSCTLTVFNLIGWNGHVRIP